jgi:CheY-like chemotaxis protein
VEDGQVVVRVRDRGPGIPEAGRAQLFTRFGRLEGSQMRAGRSGTGLGLYLSRMLARAMEGDLALESSGAAGSTFLLRLPAGMQGAEPAEPAPVTVPHGRVLVAEDNALHQLVVVSMLESLGCAAKTVETGRQAVAAVQQGQYDLVLMDLQLPELDGWAATAAIRAHEQAAGQGHHTPIVALTAGALAGDAEKSRAVGMDDHLIKPLTLERLAAVVTRWITPRPERS